MTWRLRIHESLPSTSDLCIALAEAGEPEGLAVLARRQTAGRGSRGRAWQSLEGNLSVSVLMRPSGPATDSGKWALLAALSLHGALRGLADVTLKWPNDVLLGGAKVAGVLIDAASDAGGLNWLVLGFGANLASSPAEDLVMPGLVPGLHAVGQQRSLTADGNGSPDLVNRPDQRQADPPAVTALGRHDPVPIARTILENLTRLRQQWLAEGFSPLRHAWLAAAHPPGTHLRVRTGVTDVGGTFAGLADDGALLLATGGRVRAFPTGEVLLGC